MSRKKLGNTIKKSSVGPLSRALHTGIRSGLDNGPTLRSLKHGSGGRCVTTMKEMDPLALLLDGEETTRG